MDDMSRIILIGNTTFTFTEENHEENLMERRNCQENQWKPKKDNYTPFKTITISSVDQNRQDQDCHKQLEPCMFDSNFCQFGYFTQNYSNLTVYLNDETILTNTINQNPKLPNCIGLTSNPQPQPNTNPEPSPLPTSNPKFILKPNEDVPAFIDLDKLSDSPLLISDGRKKSLVVPPFLKRNRKTKWKSEDDDVIFVKEYKKTTAEEKKIFPEPRRNPKRKVQLQKLSYELAEKMSMEEFDEECRLANVKSSSKMPGAVFSPPTILSTDDFKDWPIEGMHEKPNYNALTQKLEKITVPKKLKLNLQRLTTLSKKKIPVRRQTRKQLEIEANKEFATLTHHTFHLVLSFVEQIKTYNKLVKKPNEDLSPNVLELDHLKDAEKLLTYSSILYSIANNVSSSSLVSYLEVLKKNGTVNV